MGFVSIDRSMAESHPRAFAVIAEGGWLEPDATHGDMLLIDPELEPRPGDIVLLNGKEAPHLERFVRSNVFPIVENNSAPLPFMANGEKVAGVCVCRIGAEASG